MKEESLLWMMHHHLDSAITLMNMINTYRSFWIWILWQNTYIDETCQRNRTPYGRNRCGGNTQRLSTTTKRTPDNVITVSDQEIKGSRFLD